MDVTDNETMLRHCWSCDGWYPATTNYFHRDRSKWDGLHGSCKLCTRARKSKWQKENPEKLAENQRRFWSSRRSPRINRTAENKQHIWSAKEQGYCIFCGEQQTEVLLFHHREPTKKTFVLSDPKARPLAEIKAEITKCDLLCANCHLSLHYWEKHN